MAHFINKVGSNYAPEIWLGKCYCVLTLVALYDVYRCTLSAHVNATL